MVQFTILLQKQSFVTIKTIVAVAMKQQMLRFHPPTIFKLVPSPPFHILHLPSMQDQVVERPEQL
jgi:hypothetical protein